MKIRDHHVLAIESLGYTPPEAQFLYLVAAFSGCFVPRQFLRFLATTRGKRPTSFTQKLERRGDATWREYLNIGGVYELVPQTLCRMIDREVLGNHRRRSAEYIATRLLLLDFILGHQNFEYLESEQEKVNFFHQELGVAMAALPLKAHRSRTGGPRTVRYFADHFPLFFESSEDRAQGLMTFSYVEAREATLSGFTHHLSVYAPLFSKLPKIRFAYISNSSLHFRLAEGRFRSLFDRHSGAANPSKLVRYFQLRAAWEQRKYASLSTADIEWLEKTDEKLRSPEIDSRFAAWLNGTLDPAQLGADPEPTGQAPELEFTAHLITPEIDTRPEQKAKAEAATVEP